MFLMKQLCEKFRKSYSERNRTRICTIWAGWIWVLCNLTHKVFFKKIQIFAIRKSHSNRINRSYIFFCKMHIFIHSYIDAFAKRIAQTYLCTFTCLSMCVSVMCILMYMSTYSLTWMFHSEMQWKKLEISVIISIAELTPRWDAVLSCLASNFEINSTY